MKNVLILGATSEISEQLVSFFSSDVKLFLAGRNTSKLVGLKKSCAARGIQSELIEIDFSSLSFMPAEKFANLAGTIDTIISFVGSMGGDQHAIENLEEVYAVNFLNPVRTILYFLPELVKKPDTQIVVVSSVAGERGRKKNYVYGSAKGALTLFASGLRADLSDTNVKVTTIILGLVDTWMTEGMKSPLIASKTVVAGKIFKAIQCKKDVVFIPFYWRSIMFIIRMIPECFFKKMSF